MIQSGQNMIYLFGGKYYDEKNKPHYSNEIWRYYVKEKKWEDLTTISKGISSITRNVKLWNGDSQLIDVPADA